LQFSDLVASRWQAQALPEFSSSCSFFSFSQHFWAMSLAAPKHSYKSFDFSRAFVSLASGVSMKNRTLLGFLLMIAGFTALAHQGIAFIVDHHGAGMDAIEDRNPLPLSPAFGAIAMFCGFVLIALHKDNPENKNSGNQDSKDEQHERLRATILKDHQPHFDELRRPSPRPLNRPPTNFANASNTLTTSHPKASHGGGDSTRLHTPLSKS
jgi:hypothetical protein